MVTIVEVLIFAAVFARKEALNCWIKSKYGESNLWCSNNSSMPYGCGAWRTIRDLWPKLEENMIIKVGDGEKTNFWGDAWSNQTPLKNDFPDLFSICNNPEATVKECWTDQGWDLSFRRLLNDWEVDRVANLLLRLEDFTGTTPNPDSMRWKHNKDGNFSVKRAYEIGNAQLNRRQHFLWNNVWKNIAPTKVKCFTWLVARKACLTHEVLRKKGKIIDSSCQLCGETNETNSHLFLHCKFTTQLWTLFLTLTETKWTMPEHTADLLSCWIRRGGSKSQKKWWRIIPHCIWWSVWKERNSRSFEDRSNSIHTVKWNCIVSFYLWRKEIDIDELELVDLLGSL